METLDDTKEAALPRQIIVVRADWDDEAKVWVASSEDVEGLITEADSLEALSDKLAVIIPELLELNGGLFANGEIPVHILAGRTTRVIYPGPSA